MSLDEEAENILKRLIEKGSVDFYELVDKYADEKKISVAFNSLYEIRYGSFAVAGADGCFQFSL